MFICGEHPSGRKCFKVDFFQSTFMRAYRVLLQSKGKWNRDAGNDISGNDFRDGNSLFVFHLEPFFAQHGAYLSLVKTGNVRLEVQLKTVLTGNQFTLYFFSSLYFCFVVHHRLFHIT